MTTTIPTAAAWDIDSPIVEATTSEAPEVPTLARTTEAGLFVFGVVLALALRWPLLARRYWFDELQTLAIAERPLAQIPSALRRDGSPPLYLLALHGWIRAFGDDETATHSLGLVLTVGLLAAAWWAARRIAGSAAGVLALFACALNPFLAYYATETRNYTFFAFLGALSIGVGHMVVTTAGRWRIAALGGSIAALLYTHAWAAFFVPALFFALAAVCLRDRPARRRVTTGFAIGGVLFVPWLPTFASQARSTGAPWLHAVDAAAASRSLTQFFGGTTETMILVFAGAAIAFVTRVPKQPFSRAVIGACALTVALGWLTSELMAPMWSPRYAIVVLPCVLIAFASMASRSWIGLLLFVTASIPTGLAARNQSQANDPWDKSEVVAMAEIVRDTQPTTVVASDSDLVAISRYSGASAHLSPAGQRTDPSMVDWRNSLVRLRASDPEATVKRAIAELQPGQVMVIVWHPGPKPNASEWVRLEQSTMATAAETARRALLPREVRAVDGWRIEIFTRDA